jgi:alpha-L-rhamnosidase
VIWLYESLAGIRPDEAAPGFKHIVMRPDPVPGLDWVKASLRSPYGLIQSSWQKKGEEFAWQITVPVGATATAYVPGDDVGSVTEGGKPLAEAEGLEVVGPSDGRVELRLGSGNYEFVSQ